MLNIKEKLKECKILHDPTPLKMAFFDSIHFVPDSWDELVGESNLYLTTAYLSAIEDSMSGQISFKYVLFFQDKEPVALAAFQIVSVDSKSLDLEYSSKSTQLVGKVLDHFTLNCLINGTLFSSGEHGFYYSDKLTDEVAFKALTEGVKKLCALEEESIQVIMVKEYFPENTSRSNHLIKYKYRDFKMEPNMVLDLKTEWQNMEDYFASMTSKYRKNAKSKLKKSDELVVKDLSVSEIKKYQAELVELFHSVHSKAKYKLETFDVGSFEHLRENLGDLFLLKGYFINDELIGFSSGFLNNGDLEANYVGINYDYNKSHNIYLRMLYDFVDIAIQNKMDRVLFGRTAGEIKSNLGAKAIDMECYIRTKNSVSNKVIKPLVKRVSTPDFVVRNPFKD